MGDQRMTKRPQFRQSFAHVLKSSARMRKLNLDPAFRAKQDAGRRLINRSSSFQVPPEHEDWYRRLTANFKIPAREAARMMKLELKERRHAQDKT